MKNQVQLKDLFVCYLLLLAVGCAKPSGTDSQESANVANSFTQPQVKVTVEVKDSSSNIIYSDVNKASSLVLRSGQNYILDINAVPANSGVTYTLQLKNTSNPNAVMQTIALHEGANNLSIATQGDYSMKIVAQRQSMMPLTKFYNASVTCANPTFTAASLNGSAISVSSSASNLYDFNVAGVIASANGQAPYKCAIDGTGSGIIDTAFVDCSKVISKFYSNYVSNRNVSVVVKDSCNIAQSASNIVNLAYSVPAMGAGNVFIHGIISNATDALATDKRTAGVHYLATNVGGHNIVQANYSGSKFTVVASQNYGMASSVKFGMKVNISGITGSVDAKTMSGTLSATSAKINSIEYSTDQSGDSAAALTLSSSNCTLSNQNIKVLYVAGTPCSDGSGTNNNATVEMWGQYVCTNVGSAGNADLGTMTITGSFDGLYSIVDSCSGGGGGGGGVPPINF